MFLPISIHIRDKKTNVAKRRNIMIWLCYGIMKLSYADLLYNGTWSYRRL